MTSAAGRRSPASHPVVGALLLLVLLLITAAPAAAHPLGLPAFARVSVDAGGVVTVVWNAAPDDVAALARSLGFAVQEGEVLSRAEDARVSSSVALREALTQGITVAQAGTSCRPAVEVSSLVEQGATLRYTCPSPATAVVLRLTLLTELDDRYRTLAVAGTTEGTERVMFTSAAPEHPLRLDATNAGLVDLTALPAPEPPAVVASPFGGSLPFEGTFVALIDRSAGAGGLALGLLVALGVGAAHGLAPGHGKAITASYLVGDRGRPRDAVLLGMVVALLHTGSVLALGFALYSATQRPSTAFLSTWLQLVSGVIVLGLGGWLLRRRLREQRHPSAHAEHAHAQHAHAAPGQHGHHHHDVPEDVHPLSWQGLVALGAAGGLLPSPSALLVLFTALAAGRLGYGLSLIALFSTGLALTVTLVGLAALRGRDLLRSRAGDEASRARRLLRVLPVLGAAGVTGLGAILVIRAGVALLPALRAAGALG